MNSKLKCILVIDDDEPTNYFNQLMLQKLDCAGHIQVAQSGQEALEYLTHSQQFDCGEKRFPCPDLILLDINMPAMDGWEFLERYKKMNSEHKGKVIVVMLTTSMLQEDMQKARETPEISGYEHKPLTADNLNRILDKYFD